MRAKCPKCGAVFERTMIASLIHVGSLKFIKCPSCGKRSLMNTGVDDPVNWPPEPTKSP